MAKNTSRKSRTGMAPVTAGAILAVVLIVITYFGFTKHVPFTHGYRLQAVFESSNNLRPGSPVRIAGVNVGKVKKVERAGSSNAAVVTMELDNKALPIHKTPR
jgi:ABC-type transporter Mla subunit MlaD